MPTNSRDMAEPQGCAMCSSYSQLLVCQKRVSEITIFTQTSVKWLPYLYHIVQNHPFTDGNKRTGAMAAFVFLKLNKLTLKVPESAYEELVLKTAQGEIGKDIIAGFFRKNTRP